MSSNVDRVCASCATFSKVTISCTKCLNFCCSGCFGDLVGAMMASNVDVALLTARICRKCIEGPRRPNAARRNAGGGAKNVTVSAHDQQGICRLHAGKTLKLYCVNCAVGICADCLNHGEPHSLHQVNNLAAVYLDKASGLGSKLIQAEKINDEMRAATDVYRRNLEMIEKEEESALKQIEAIAAGSKLAITRVTSGRKDILQEKLRVPTENGVALQELRDKTQQLSPYELMDQLPEFEKKCDELIARKSDITLQKVDDISCALIPCYRFAEVVFCGFQNAATDVCVFETRTAHDVEWIFTVRKADMLQVEPKTKDAKAQKFRYMLIVVVLHPEDSTKTVNLTFDLEGQNKIIDVMPSAHLVEQGFCSAAGSLVLRIGIRCPNALFDRQVLKHQYNQVKARLPSITYKHDFGFLVMHFHPKLTDLAQDVTLSSSHIKDDKKRCWFLKVSLQSNNVRLLLTMHKGKAICCDVFIELVHGDRRKTMVIRGQHTFTPERNDYWGWSKLIRLDVLKTDAGFQPDGKLHIRFGVRPEPVRIAATPSKAAAANA